MTPILKWAGGKRWLAPRIKSIYESCNSPRLVEPFSGGLSVALTLDPHDALLCDINEHLINLYEHVQSGLIVKLPAVLHFCFYDKARLTFNTLIQTGEEKSKKAAVIFYYLNRTCFNGLCRFNSKGLFNVPYGQYKTINYTSDFSGYSPTFKKWEFMSRSWKELELRDGDFLYADPPYDVQFTKYSKEDFKWDEQQELAQWLSEHSGPVVASNQATERIVSLYKSLDFNVEIIEAPRRISCNGDRKPAMEILATRNIQGEL